MSENLEQTQGSASESERERERERETDREREREHGRTEADQGMMSSQSACSLPGLAKMAVPL